MKKKFILLFFFINLSLYSISSPNSLLDAGINDYQKGQYEFAINNLKKFIQFSDNNTNKPEAYYYLALSYYYLENYKMSLNYLNELITKYRTSSYSSIAHFWKGLIYQNLKEWENALEAFERYITLYPQTDLVDRAYFAAANCLLELNRLKDSEKYLKIIIDKFKKFEKYEEASVFYAYILIKNNKKEIAKNFLYQWNEKLGKTGEKFEYRDRFWLYLAEILLEEKEYEQAKILFKKIDVYSKNSPSSDIALLRLSQIESLLGNEKESKEYIIRLNNEYPLSKYNLDATLNSGISEYLKNNHKDAINFFNIVNLAITKKIENEKLTSFEKERLFSIHSTSLFYAGESYYRLLQNNDAKEKFLEIINRNYPLKTKALIRIIEILFEEKNFKELEKVFNTYQNIFKEETDDYENFIIYKTRYLYYINKNKESLELLNKIKENNRNFLSILDLKVKNQIKLSNYKDAIDLLVNAFPYIPLNKKAYYGYEICSLYFNLSLYDKALEFYNIATSFINDSDNSEINIKLEYIKALSLMGKKEYLKAIDIFKTIIKLDNKKFNDIINNCYYYLAWCYYKISNFIDSAKFFGLASNFLNDTDLIKESAYMEAMSYFSNRDYNTSYLKFDFIYKKYYPQEIGIMALYYRAKSLENSNKINEAVVDYTKIYNEATESKYKILSLFDLIKYNLDKNKIEEANNLIKILENIDKQDNLYFQALLLQAQAFISLKRYSEAFSIYNYYLKNSKDSKDMDYIYYWAAYCAEEIKDYISAKYFYETLVAKYFESKFYLMSLYSLLKIYKTEGNYLKERENINKILLIEKNNQKIQELYQRLREIELIEKGVSEEEANLLLKIEKGDIEAKLTLAKIYIKGKDREKGIQILTSISQERSDTIGAMANNILGDLQLEENKYKEALTIYLKTVQNYNSTKELIAEALYKVSYCYYKLENYNLALKIIERIKKDFGETEWANKAIEIEKRLQK